MTDYTFLGDWLLYVVEDIPVGSTLLRKPFPSDDPSIPVPLLHFC